MDIYQQIWQADQSGNGLRAILSNQSGDPVAGFVKVAIEAAQGADPRDHRVLTEVSMPSRKRATYDSVLRLFDNYALDEQSHEDETPEERQEVHDLLDAVIDTAPMQVARSYVSDATGTPVSRDRWYATLLELWFRRFSQSGDPALSGFEHVFVGEQEGAKAQGYHFWFKYHLDDGLAQTIDRTRFPGFKDDRIVYLRGMQDNGQEHFPESVTISYRWEAPDYDRGVLRPLTKPKGGFFVGCSVEGLMALGAVRAHLGARAPKEALINGARYDLKLFRSENDQHIRTFYPVFLGPAGTTPDTTEDETSQPILEPITAGSLRILAALVNPAGDDPGMEKVTLLNAGPSTASLEGWFLVDKMKNRFGIKDVRLAPGVATTITLPRSSIQLGNNGGEIRLVDRDGHTAHLVTYTKAQAKREGHSVIF